MHSSSVWGLQFRRCSDVIEIEPFTLRLAGPLETARGSIREREGYTVTVEYGGERGIGEATPLLGWTESPTECRSALERATDVAETLDWGVALAKLEEPAARHALSLALADARSRSTRDPLYRALGGKNTVSEVPVQATVGTDETLARTTEAARRAVREGFRTIKLTLGTRSVEADTERVRAVRNAVGGGVDIRVDVDGAWTEREAMDGLDRLAALDVEYVEQPLPARDLGGHAELRGRGVDIALDESLTVHDISTVLEVDAADVLVLKPMVQGGPDLTRLAAMEARGAGVEPVVSTTVEGVVARTGAVHVAASIPGIGTCGVATGELLVTDLGPDPAPVEEGAISVPQDNGLGLWDPR